MPISDFKGYQSRSLKMPDGGQIICFFYRNNATLTSVDDGNRNVFRLDRDGNVMWQITRIDYPETNWELKHKEAREQGQPGCIDPFIRFYLEFPDGSNNRDSYTGTPPDVADWVPGCKVELSNLGIGTQWYSLDVDTGIAVETTPKGHRPW